MNVRHAERGASGTSGSDASLDELLGPLSAYGGGSIAPAAFEPGLVARG